LTNSSAMGTWGPAWAGAQPYKQDGEGGVIPPAFLMLAGGDQETSLAQLWCVGQKRGSSRSPCPRSHSFPRARGPHFYRFTVEDPFMHSTTEGSPGQQISQCGKQELSGSLAGLAVGTVQCLAAQ